MIRVISATLSILAIVFCTDTIRKNKITAKGVLPLAVALINAVFAIYDSYYTFYFLFELLTSDYPLYQPESFRVFGIEDHPRWATIASCCLSILLIVSSRTSARSRS